MKKLVFQVFACSTSTSQMHQSWMSTHPTEDYEGLGFRFKLFSYTNSSIHLFMSPVSTVFSAAVTVSSWTQKHTQSESIYAIILDVHV